MKSFSSFIQFEHKPVTIILSRPGLLASALRTNGVTSKLQPLKSSGLEVTRTAAQISRCWPSATSWIQV
jgi:hypothetical protein